MKKKRLLAILATAGVALTGAAVAIIPMTGASAADCAAGWSSSAVYTGGNIASHGGRNWRAHWWTQGETPGTTGEWGVWRDQGTCSGGGGGTNPPPPPPPPPAGGNVENWQAGRFYPVGSVVRFTDGQCYVAEHANNGLDPVVSHWYWNPTTCSGGGSTNPPPPGNSGGFPLSEAQFNQMFPGRNSFYTYSGLIDAAGKFAQFAKTGSDTIRKQEIAAFLANANHETGGLVHVTEIDKSRNMCGAGVGCPAGPYAYYGRGPIQLSWNFNYNAAGQALGLPLLNEPHRVEQSASVAWQTAIWYWTTQNGPGSMTAHAAMVNSRGFGETIRSINGSLECNGGNPGQVQSRVNAYVRFTGILGVAPGGNLSC